MSTELLLGGLWGGSAKFPSHNGLGASTLRVRLKPCTAALRACDRQFRNAAVGQLPLDNLSEDLAVIGAQQTHVLLSSSESRAVATVLQSCRLGDIPLRRFFRLLLKDPVFDYATSLFA